MYQSFLTDDDDGDEEEEEAIPILLLWVWQISLAFRRLVRMGVFVNRPCGLWYRSMPLDYVMKVTLQRGLYVGTEKFQLCCFFFFFFFENFWVW